MDSLPRDYTDRCHEGEPAFERLYNNGGSDRDLCDKWNEFTTNPENKAKCTELLKDDTFMQRYLAVIYAKTVPSKRKRIADFLEFLSDRSSRHTTDPSTDLDMFD